MTEDSFEADTKEHPLPQKTARDLPRLAQWAVLLAMGMVIGSLFGSAAGLASYLPGF